MTVRRPPSRRERYISRYGRAWCARRPPRPFGVALLQGSEGGHSTGECEKAEGLSAPHRGTAKRGCEKRMCARRTSDRHGHACPDGLQVMCGCGMHGWPCAVAPAANAEVSRLAGWHRWVAKGSTMARMACCSLHESFKVRHKHYKMLRTEAPVKCPRRAARGARPEFRSVFSQRESAREQTRETECGDSVLSLCTECVTVRGVSIDYKMVGLTPKHQIHSLRLCRPRNHVLRVIADWWRGKSILLPKKINRLPVLSGAI